MKYSLRSAAKSFHKPRHDKSISPVLHDQKLQHKRLEEQAENAALYSQSPSFSATTSSMAQPKAEVSGVGKKLGTAQRNYYEQRLGTDLSNVRIHDDPSAAQQADEMGANAFTQGDHIVLGREHNSTSVKGEQQLAHELAHTAQQQKPGATPTVQCDDQTPAGIGLSPPSASFIPIEGIGAEDGFVLFPRDNADLDRGDRGTINDLIGHPSGPVTVHVHGYASQDGDEEYNQNLSAHRAVAVKEYIEGLVPEGSRVVAYAHGETSEFGNWRANRRVGIDIINEHETPASEPSRGAFGVGGPSFELDLDLRLDLDLDLHSMRALSPVLSSGMSPSQALSARIMAPAPEIPGIEFDVGAIAPYYHQRGVPLSQRDARSYEEHFTTWRDRYMLWGLPPERAAWLAQIGTESEAETLMSFEYPTRTEQLDRMMGTDPTIIPVFNDAMMRWLFEQMR